ncbi:MAG: hypothetical protein IPF73_05150 [Betaproteobacteria bacterium]|nr:hypothetical protein [Betaproteobacteria bacterium]
MTCPDVLIRTSRLPPISVSHSAPSVPATIAHGSAFVRSRSNSSVTVPAVVIRPTWSAPYSVNQSAPSGPAAMYMGSEFGVGIGNSVSVPVGVMRPIRLS